MSFIPTNMSVIGEDRDAMTLDYHDDWLHELEWLDSDDDEIINTSESNTICDESSGVQKPKKKRIRSKRVRKSTVLVPRLFKRDIRRHYAWMFTNVINSQDYSLLQAFLRTYSTNCLILRRHEYAASSIECAAGTKWSDHFSYTSSLRKPCDIHGISSFADLIYLATRLHPDHVVSVDDVKVVSRRDSKDSKVVYRSHIDFTLMYDIHPVYFMDSVLETMQSFPSPPETKISQSQELSPFQSAPVTLSSPIQFPSATSSSIDPFDHFEARTGQRMPRLRSPLPISITAQITLHVGADRRISVIEVDELALGQ